MWREPTSTSGTEEKGRIEERGEGRGGERLRAVGEGEDCSHRMNQSNVSYNAIIWLWECHSSVVIQQYFCQWIIHLEYDCVTLEECSRFKANPL